MMKNNTFLSLQGLRGLAALSVMLFHFRYLINSQTPGLGDYLFGWGSIGVDAFFIISGFVITLSANKLGTGNNACRNFLISRMWRIMPVYFILLLVTFIFSGGMSTFHYPDKVNNLISALTFSPIYTDRAPFYVNDSGVYGIRWTLNYEMYFYLITAACLVFPKPKTLLVIYFTLALIIIPVSTGKALSISENGYQFDNPFLNLMTNPVSWMFISGVLLAAALPLMNKLNTTIKGTYLACATAYATFSIFLQGNTGHGLSSVGLPLILFVAGIIMNETWLSKITPRWLLFFGDVSFSLYLIHTLMNTGLGRRLDWTGATEGISGFILFSICSIILATISYRFIEKPVMRYKKRSLTNESVIA